MSVLPPQDGTTFVTARQLLVRRIPREPLLRGGAICAQLESPDWHLTGNELPSGLPPLSPSH